MLKKPSLAFSASPLARRDSLVAHIFNGLRPSKMAARPVPRRRLSKNRVFQQPASGLYHPNREQRCRQSVLDSRSRQRDDTTSGQRVNGPTLRGGDDNEDNAVTPEPLGPMEVAGDIFVASRRRCEDIDVRLAPRSPRQDPPALLPIRVVQVTSMRAAQTDFLCPGFANYESSVAIRIGSSDQCWRIQESSTGHSQVDHVSQPA